MRILALVTDAFGGHGGIAKFNRDLLTALCAAPDVAEVVAIPRLMPEPPGGLPARLRFVTAGVGGKLRYGMTALRVALRTPRPALIFCGHINLLPVAFAARLLCRAPVVLVIHGIDAWQPTRSRLVNRLVRRVNAVIAVSEFTRERFLAWARPTSARSFILPNCVDLARFLPGPKQPRLVERYGLENRTVLLTVARLSAQERYKGIDEVLEVLPMLAKQIPSLSYLIVGDGSDRARLEQKAAQLGVSNRVIFAGRIADSETAEHYRLAEVFVMPSRGEGFGIVYLEALACGVPVVASTADASGEVVRGCALATQVDPGNLQDVQSGILRALKFPRGVRPPQVGNFSTPIFSRRCVELLGSLRGTANAAPDRGGVAALSDVSGQ